MKKYLYNGKAYLSEKDLRSAIFEKERKAFAKAPYENEAEFWSKFGVTCVEEKIEITEEEQSLINLMKAKRARKVAVANIVVEVDGMTFDGDEISQDRMTRSIVAMTDEDSIPWVLADNSIAIVSKNQLKTALRLSGLKQSELWIVPYEG